MPRSLALLVALAALAAGCNGDDILTNDHSRGPIATLVIAPDSVALDARETYRFTAYGLTATNDSVPVANLGWSTTNGSINNAGVYVADTVPGDYMVSATDGDGHQATARVKLGRRLAQVVLTPATVTVEAGRTVQFFAYGRSRSGDSISTSVTYSAMGGTISTTGLYQASSATGTYRVTATHGNGMADTSVVTIVPATTSGPAVASIAVNPASASVSRGATATLTAAAKDAAGATLSGVSITWSSSNSAVATVNATGVVTGVAAGTATITAAGGGKTGTSAITVSASTDPECGNPQPGWIFCDDFEQDRLSRYFEYNSAGGSFSRAGSVGVGGSSGMRVRWSAGQTDAGALHLAFGRTPQAAFRPADAGTANHREVYWRMYVKFQSGWVGGGADKLSRAFIFSSPSSWAQAMIAHVWSGQGGSNVNYLSLDPASGTDEGGTVRTTGYNDWGNMRWLGRSQGSNPLFANPGRWYCVEAHVKLNSAGQSDGTFELWIDGTRDISQSGLNWVGNYSEYGINAIYFENYWNAGSPQAQERYLDNFVVSTQRIGCL